MWFWSPVPRSSLWEMACRNLPSSIASEAAAEKLLTLAMQVMPVPGGSPEFSKTDVSSGRQSMLQDCGDVSYSFHIRGECCFYILFSLSILIHAYMVSIYQYSIPILWCQVPEAFHGHSATAKVRASWKGMNHGKSTRHGAFHGKFKSFQIYKWRILMEFPLNPKSIGIPLAYQSHPVSRCLTSTEAGDLSSRF